MNRCRLVGIHMALVSRLLMVLTPVDLENVDVISSLYLMARDLQHGSRPRHRTNPFRKDLKKIKLTLTSLATILFPTKEYILCTQGPISLKS